MDEEQTGRPRPCIATMVIPSMKLASRPVRESPLTEEGEENMDVRTVESETTDLEEEKRPRDMPDPRRFSQGSSRKPGKGRRPNSAYRPSGWLSSTRWGEPRPRRRSSNGSWTRQGTTRRPLV